MTLKRVLTLSAIIMVCFLSTGCFTFEQEIFLNPDNSGEFVFHMSLPDFPDSVKANESGPKTSPEDTLNDFRATLTRSLTPGSKIKEVKEVRQNGTQGFYAIVQFSQLKDVQSIMNNFAKEAFSKNGAGKPMNSEWSLMFNKVGNRTTFTQKVFVDTSDQKPEKKPDEKTDGTSKAFDDQITALMLSMVKMRFVLHASSPITDSNADVILNKNTAVWDCSLAAFLKDKKPIEMKASF